jgi:hypothetical protein
MRTPLALLLLAIAVAVPGCSQLEKVSRPPATTWIIAYDATASQSLDGFARYPDAGRAGALELLRPGDEVVVLLLDGSPEPVVHSVRKIDHRLTSVTRAARETLQDLRGLRLSTNRRGTTNLGAIAAHIGRRIELERGLESGHAPRPFRVIWVSDGLPTGRQTPADWRAIADTDVRVAFCGAAPGARPKIERLFADAGFAGPDRLLVVEASHVEQMLTQLPTFMGRHPNRELAALLAKDTASN